MSVTPRKQTTTPPLPPPPPQPLSFLSEIQRFQSCWDSAVKQCDPFVISPRLPNQTSPRLPSPRDSPVNEIFLCTTKQRSLHLKNQRRKTTTKNITATTAVAANSPRGPNPTTTAAISNSDNSYDDEKRGNEQWWLLKDLYEQEESLLPRHVTRCIQTITQDYVLLSRSPQAHTNNAPSNWTIPNFSEEHVYQQFDPTKNSNSSLIPSTSTSSSTSTTSSTQQLVSSNDIKKQAISDNNNNNGSNVKKWAAARSKSMLVSNNNNGNNNNLRSSSNNNNHVNNNDTNNNGENAQQKPAPMIDDLWNVHDEIEKNCRHDDRANFVLNVMSESQPATFLELLNQTMVEMERDSSDLIISDFDLLEEIQCSTSRVLFSPKRLNIKLLDAIKETALEPIYCSVTIYEINGSECNKITESYSFEISSNESLNEKHAAIFKLSAINSNMMALFKFSRKYLGDDAEMVNEVYSKAKIKDVKSMRTKIQKSHESFPDLYSSFAWSAVNLKEALDSPLQALPLFLLPSSIGNVRDPVLLQQFLSSDSKKYKSIDGFITLTFSELMAKYEEYVLDAPEARIVLEDEKGNEIRGVPVKTLLPLNNMTLAIENNCLLLPHSVTISKEIKNIQIVASLQMDDSDIEKTGIPVFYTNYPEMSTEMQSSAFSTVSCNNTSPEFSSEMKLKLPFQPKESQNILFKFYNCTSKESLLKKNGVKKLVGYSYINLTSVSQGKVTLPIYKVDGKMSKYLTNQNRYSYGCFELEIVHRSLNFQSSDCSLEPFKHFVNSIQDYTNVDNAAFTSGTNCLSFISFSLAQYVPMILNELVAIFKHTTSAELRTNCFSVIMRVVHKFAKEDMASILAYVKYYFNDSDILHIFLSETRKFMESKVEFNVSFILHNSWFLFSVLLKSLILHYQTCDLSESSVADLTLLFTESLASFIDAHSEKNIQHIGAEVGSFVTNLLSAGLSRTLILSLIYNIIAMFNKISTPIASNMLLCFMYHLFQFQNYLELCLPRPAERRAVNKSRSNQDVPSVTHRHFLFTNLVDCVMRGLSNSSRDNRSKACALMYEIVCQSTWDSRYQDAVHKKRINQMHFEFVQRFTEVVHDWNTQVDSHKKKIQKEIAKVKQKIAGIESNKKNTVDTDKSMRPQSIDQVQFEMVHSELLRLTSKYLDDLKTEDSAAKFERQLVYGLIYHIIRNVDNTKLSAWLFYVNHGQQAHFLGILQSILTAFEFGKDVRNKKKKDNLPARIQRNMKSSRFSRRDVKQQTNTLHAISNKLDNSFQKLKSMSLFEAAKQHVRSRSAGVEDVDLNSLKNFDKNIGLSRPTSPTSPSTHPPQLVEEELVPKKHQSSLPRRARHSMSLSSSIFEKYIPCDMGYHILWLLAQTVLELTRSGITMSPTGRQQLASTIATVLTSYLHLSQPDFLLTQVMTYIRALVNQYPLLACSKSSLAPLLSESLLCLCNSNTDVVRTNAVRTEYTLLKIATLTEKGNALWPQVLSNLSISRLLQKMKNCVVLSASIQEIPECTKLDSSLNMTEQERLSANLRTLCHQMNQLILGTVEIACSISGADVYKSEYLLLNISKLYNIPELKVMWLMRLAEFHNKNQQYAECAQCYLLVIATILERMDKELVKLISVESFYKLSPLLSNRRSEPQKMSYKSEAHNDSISIFDEQGFLTTISKAINAFINAEQYEHCIPLFDMIIPIYQRAGDIKNVASAYHQLADIYEKIRTTGNERQFSVFYQVGFFGSQWGPEINCKQFIYKTPKLFKLFRMTDRLKKIYPNVEIISSSTDKKTLDDSKRYIQVTGVKPLINRTSKTTKFEESLNISQFYYEHAFSKTTKKVSDSNLVEIFKKKIIFTVDGSFPNVITRLPIIKEQETILTPIEAAIDNIQNQIHKIEQVLETSFTDVQELQLILQGSVRAGVNGGPQEIVTTFLDSEKRSNFDAVHVETLDNLCHYFLYLCDQALTLNGKFIRVYKKNMQSELESGLNELKALFSRYIQSTKKFDKDYVSLKHTSIIPADAFDEEDKDKTNDFDAMCISLFKLPRNRNYHGAE